MRSLFDIRRIIGALFVLYGILLTIVGILDGQEALQKALGVRINLWVGIGMLIIGLVFLIWERLRPATLEFRDEDPARGADHGATRDRPTPGRGETPSR